MAMKCERVIRHLQKFFIKLNLFEEDTDDEHQVRLQLWSTRLYIPVLSLAMIVLVTYTITNVSTKQVEISNPSLSNYFALYDKYKNVRCPCTEISTSYQTLVQLSAIFHEVCSSDLTSMDWIKFLFENNGTTTLYAVDFRVSASNQFQVLQRLCQLSSDVIQNSIEAFYTSNLISGELLTENLFKNQLEADISRFQMSTISDFGRTLTFMRSLTFSNILIPAIQTAYTFTVSAMGALNSFPLYVYFRKTDSASVIINVFRKFKVFPCQDIY